MQLLRTYSLLFSLRVRTTFAYFPVLPWNLSHFHRPTNSFITNILSTDVTPHIYLNSSPTSNLFSRALFTAHVSAPYIITCVTSRA